MRPFAALPENISLSISGRVTLEETWLTIAYSLSGDWEQAVILPSRSQPSRSQPSRSKRELEGARRDRLWEQTCFEFFLAWGSKPTIHTPYWEFNLSPSGDWNVFSLESYRQGPKEEAAISHLPLEVERKSKSFRLNLHRTDVSSLVSANQPLWLGVSAVVLLETGRQTFWAIAHPAPEPDFHHPGSFVLAL
ncbi:hypothetical protein S7335_1910 [Synechococcus sp. PCC 7335]|nr:hypothetical protein S7335_1910 [Synechococcus sp. PCC 7335]